MSIEPEAYVSAIISSAGGSLVSRIRLQKIAYLLDKITADSKFHYTYHHYGPYSRDLDNAILDAEAFGLIEENYERRKSDGARYSVFKTLEETQSLAPPLSAKQKSLVSQFSKVNVTVLELAATAHWLAFEEKVGDWHSEIIQRKGSKTEAGRLDKAVKLLQDLGINLPGTTN
ncbi:hypothetical protein [Aureimonas sp. D3]|uniref:hypothetical protein n=1 Tax=Aureimonas sp. D3 TaxID=1638164 RepID=UPI0012E367D0|nr:hypothetical protein [Aureimonas sp. D3]